MHGHKKAPVAPTTRAYESNAVNDQENNVMSNNSTNVIPFNFGKKLVRTMLIGDQPWFVATDVASALEYRDAFNMNRILDDDEKGTQIVSTLGGDQEMLVINESGLYSAILRSRKAAAKNFKKWVTAEVLPAIRKHGRYEDGQAKMPTLMDELIGMTETNALKGLARHKVAFLPSSIQRSASARIYSAMHCRFNVPRIELIPASQFEAACNFVASYAIEGEYISKEEAKPDLKIHYPIEALAARREGMLTIRNSEQAWLDVTMHDLRDIHGDATPLEKLLWELEEAGFDIQGAWWELRTYRNKLREFASFVTGMGRVAEDPQRYAITPRTAA